MLKLIQSNQMEILSAHLAHYLATPIEDASLLSNEAILVQSPGMSTWLRLEIAKHNGIAAGLDFPLPSSFTWQLCHQLLPDVPKENAFTKAAMTWKLIDLLPNLLADPDYAPLSQYLNLATASTNNNDSQADAIIATDNADVIETTASNTPAMDGVKLYQLCGRIADIFDQYLVYRPEWIQAWEQGQSEGYQALKLDDNQQWQPKLWRALVDYNANTLNASRYHRANLHSNLISALNDPETDISALPQRLFVFGISSMAPQTLDVLYHLAARIDVIMLSLSPCQHYWGDIVDPKVRARMALQYEHKKQLDEHWESTLEVGNPLLANNGKMGRELLDLLLSLPEENTDFGDDCYLEPTPDNLLHGVQYDILQMETLGQALGPDAQIYLDTDKRRPLHTSDNSITLRSCHSPLREVETLHDHILRQLEQQPQLEPKDIVVMMPDVAAYAPYIDAVFGTANSQHFDDLTTNSQSGNRYIPYAIADRGAAQESPLINSFLTLLNINQSRFGLTEIISILEVPAILRRFQLSDDDLSLIRRWLDDANIRWGRDETSRTELGLPSFKQNSWAFGIKRLILGYAMHDDAPMYQDALLVSGVEGQSAQALGKLLNFLETVDDYSQQFKSQLTSLGLLEALDTLLDDVYEAQDDEQQQLLVVRDALTHLQNELTEAGHQGQLDIEIMRQWFTQRLTESRVGQRYLAGSVNFCTLMPMRSIPFKMVCLLGMNDGIYPRVQHPVGFDLMAHFGPKKGDRSRRLDDRYLFLEAILSAREQLYISYIGHSERDNSERLPSMLVSELVEFCQMSYTPLSLVGTDNIDNINQAVADHMLLALPLQPFDASLYQAENEQLHSYNAQWCPAMHHQAKRFIAADSAIIPESLKALFADSTQQIESDGAIEQYDVELSALIRFYRHPAQFFLNRTLQVDLSHHIQADDNDEPFELDGLSRYVVQSRLIESAIEQQLPFAQASLIESLKASGELPLTPFDDILLNQYQKDISPLIGRVQFLTDNQAATAVNIEVNYSNTGTNNTVLVPCQFNLYGRIDDVHDKGLINYRPGTAHGRDLIQMYLRHLSLNAMGIHKHSYLLDIGKFHSFAPITAEQACNQLLKFTEVFIKGQTQPICLPPRTSFVYAQTEGSHQEKLTQAQGQWTSQQSNHLEGQDPHNQRLFQFPDDFTPEYGQQVEELFSAMISLYHSDKLAELDTFVSGLAIEQHAKVTNQRSQG